MSAIILTAGAKPVFLSENYFNRHADDEGFLTVSSGSTLRHRLYDMDADAQWTSAGSDDVTTETILLSFFLPGMATERSVDYIAVMNHNIKGLKIELLDAASAVVATPFDESAVTDANTRVSLSSPQDADKIRITMTTTQTVDAEKLVGAVIVALKTFQTEDKPIEYIPEPPLVGEKTARMADNSIRRAFRFRSDANFKFWSCRLAWSVDDETTELDRFRALAFDGDSFLVMVRPGDNTKEIFLVNVDPGTFKEPYVALSTSGGKVVSFRLQEIGFE